MLKKSLLSLAVSASLVGLTGCNISSTTDNDQVDTTGAEVGSPEYNAANAGKISTTYAIFNPGRANAVGLREAPVISDLLYNGDPDIDGCLDADSDGTCEGPTGDGTIPLALGDVNGLTEEGYNPIFNAAADLDGFSTTAAIDIPFSAAIDASSIVTTGAESNVILIPLDYTDPLTGTLNPATFKASGPAAIEASVITYATSESASATGQGNVLRINPTSPLDPATRYVIVVTNGINDAAGAPVTGSNTYKGLTSDVEFLVDDSQSTQDSLALSTSLKTFQDLAMAYAAAAGYTYTRDDIVYSFSFTTGGTTDVLNSMAAPANVVEGIAEGKGASFNITLPGKYRMTMEASLRGGADISTTAQAVYGAIATDAAIPDATAQGILAELEQQALALGLIDGSSDANAIATAQITLLGSQVTIHDSIPSPAPRVSDFSTGGASLDLGLGGTIRVSNGKITVPYYSGTVDVENDLANYATTAGNVFDYWNADDTLGTDLAAVLASATVDASAVAAPSTNVTRLFPLAKLVEYVDIPVMVVHNTTCDDATSGADYTPVIFQHGITSDRTSSLAVGATLATVNPCLATVAIDLPMHGLTNDSNVSATSANTLTALNAAMGETVSQQRHFGLKRIDAVSSTPFPMDETVVGTLQALSVYDANTVAAINAQADTRGDFFINLESFQSTRDHMRQAVMDLLNLNASLAFMDFNNDGNNDLDNSNVHFIGHSLGAILGTNFAAVNNTLGAKTACSTCNLMLPEITTVTLANPGGGVVSLLENSPSFGATIVGGLEALGTAASLDLSQGSGLFELTKSIFQASVDSGDSINFAAQLAASSTPVLTLQVVGDGADNLSDQVIPTNATTGNTLTLTALGKDYAALPAPLSGSDPLITGLGLTTVNASQDTDDDLNVVVKFTQGTHSSVADPTDVPAVHTEMNTQIVSFISSNGQDLTITDSSLVQ